MGFALEKPECIEGLLVDSACSSTTPDGGFVKGDPITKTDYKTGRECTAVTDLVHGVLQYDLADPFYNKQLSVATEGQCEVTAAGAVNINEWVGLDATDKRKFTVLTPDPAGTTYRQAFRALSEAVADGDKFIIEFEPQMIKV